MTIHIIDRRTKKPFEEKVYGGRALRLLYKETGLSKILCFLIAKLPLASFLFGLWQRAPWTRYKVAPFVNTFQVDLSESVKKKFSSFNDFFTRKIHPREIASSALVAPADGRYLVYEDVHDRQEVFVKGKTLSIRKLLGRENPYQGGNMIIARLAPPDYHRFHFPVDGVPHAPRRIGGYLYSVSPIALRRNIGYLTENKRIVIDCGTALVVAIGATNVGSIACTYKPGKEYKKGDELGYFAFGASMLIVLTPPMPLASDLLQNSATGIETLCRMGESLLQG